MPLGQPVSGPMGGCPVGELRSTWDENTDALSTWRYELRYGVADVTWANATPLVTVDATAFNTSKIDNGTWDILIKAIDNAGKESANAARAEDVFIDIDAISHVIASSEAGKGSTVLMTLVNNGTQWVVDSAETWNALFPNAMSTYTNALYSYQSPGAATYISEELDPNEGDITAVWTAESSYEVLSGSPVGGEVVQVFESAVWTSPGGLSASDTGSKCRYYVSETSVVFIVTPPTRLSVDVVTRTFHGFSTTSNSTYDRITISPAFVSYTSIEMTIEGTTLNVSGKYDLDPSSPYSYVDFYAYNSSDAKVAVNYSYTIRGI